jgi:hypothetical protein
MRRTIQTAVPPRWSAALAAVPESGMGFHLVDVVLKDGRRYRRVPVYNLAVMELPDTAGPLRADDIADLFPSGPQKHH